MAGRGMAHDVISIHVPRVEDDYNMGGEVKTWIIFQSTSPVWRTTDGSCPYVIKAQISIHVPRVEDDLNEFTLYSRGNNFNPRPPCGGRRRPIE